MSVGRRQHVVARLACAIFLKSRFAIYYSLNIKYSKNDRGLSFAVLVVPRSARSEIVGEHDNALRVRVTASPVKGAANRELIRVLAKSFDLSQNAVEIVSGINSKRKIVRILGADAARLEQVISLQK